jgi:hypothetical protein
MTEGKRKRTRRPSLLTERAPRNTHQGQRLRKLYRQFIAKLDRKNAEHEAMALTAAETTVAAEDARKRLLGGDQTREANDAVVRLENTARRARLDLRFKVESVTADEGDDWIKSIEEAQRLVEEERKNAKTNAETAAPLSQQPCRVH